MNRFTLSLLALASLLSLSGCNQPASSSAQPRSSATPLAGVPVSALARLEPAEKVIRLQAPEARQQDRVVNWTAREGDRISKGQVLVYLDGGLRLEQEVEVARAGVVRAEARLAQILAGAKHGEIERQRGEILRLQAELRRQDQMRQDEVSRWKTEEQLNRRNYERFRWLHQQGACSALDLEQRQLAWNSSVRQLQQAGNEQRRSQETLQAQLLSARGERERILEVRPSDVASARAEIQAAQAELQRAQVLYRECQIVSPLTGTLLRIHTRPGERIGDNGLGELAATQQMVAVAEVYQTDVGRLKPQQHCRLTSPALPSSLRGRVVRLGQQVQRQNIFSEQPGEQFDQRVVEVRVALDGPSSQMAGGWTNLQVQAVFEEP